MMINLIHKKIVNKITEGPQDGGLPIIIYVMNFIFLF